jgi:hypothetical protein
MNGHMTTHMENENRNVDFNALRHRIYVETIYRAKVTSPGAKVSYDEFGKLIEEFILTQTANGKKYLNEPEMKDHFSNWVARRIQSLESKPQNNSNPF